MTEDNLEDDWTNYSSAQYGTGENSFEEDENDKSNLLIDDLDFYDDNYEIEKYKGSDKYADIMKDSPVTVALGSMVFFYNLGTELLRVTTHSLQKQALKELQDLKTNPSEKNGDGINRYMLLLEEMSENLKKLQNSAFINV